MPDLPVIVAEISKNWRDGLPADNGLVLANRFEVVINQNLERGYRLQSWQLHRLIWDEAQPDGPPVRYCNETIIAVFTR